MAQKLPKFCPECGNAMEGGATCGKCGFVVESDPISNKNFAGAQATTKPAPTTQNKPKTLFEQFEKYLVKATTFAWILMLIAGIVYAIIVIFGLIALALLFAFSGFIEFLWNLVAVGLLLYGSMKIVKPIGKQMENGEYKQLVDDQFSLTISTYTFRIPKILFWAILIEIFSGGWGGLLLLIPAIFLCLLSPYSSSIKWFENAQKTNPAPANP